MYTGAEDRILGGVALFDRSQAWGDEEPNAYFQSSRPERTYRTYQLTDRQQQDLLRFLYPQLDPSNNTPQGTRDNPCPMPILFCDDENLNFVDPEFAVLVASQIYRDAWERPPPRPHQRFIRPRDVTAIETKEDIEWFNKLNHM
ncbi:hypothetical protein ANO14919_117420 [Xylariales sp. No.14919]|nr:hypothetical protein ANO14919_117420 [Xylariales sp. No.14919]